MTLLVLFGYLVIINSYCFILMGMDKRSAKKHKRRVPEKQFFMLSAIGGAAGSLLGMRQYRHKTKHRSFVIGIPLLLALNVIMVAAVFFLTVTGGK